MGLHTACLSFHKILPSKRLAIFPLLHPPPYPTHPTPSSPTPAPRSRPRFTTMPPPSRYANIRSTIATEGTDAAVHVNQRALIDKILARYASEHALFRELLQNSNDAAATHAHLCFKTVPSPTSANVDGRTVVQFVYRNNGTPFSTADWNRLRRIAEGNPDADKVGAFGVGAYTIFSVSDEPLIVSGEKALSFRWHNDNLVTRTADIQHPNQEASSSSSANPWTEFVLPSREPYPIPDIVILGEFLCASIAFTRSLCHVTVHVDDNIVLTVSKKQPGEPSPVPLPPTSAGVNAPFCVVAPNSFLTLSSATCHHCVKFRIETSESSTTLSARTVEGRAAVTLPDTHLTRFAHVTKKHPPKNARVSLFIPLEANAGVSSEDTARKRYSPEGNSAARGGSGDVCKDIAARFAQAGENGRVFIAFRTMQTTGCAVHVDAPFVPTVERDAIDLQDATLRLYNTDLLFIAGVLMRVAYEESMAFVGKKWQQEHQKKQLSTVTASDAEQGDIAQSSKMDISESKTRNNTLTGTELDAVILMKAFTPSRSTPDPSVGDALSRAFVSCLPCTPLLVLTNSGAVHANYARLPDADIDKFVSTNVVPNRVAERCTTFLRDIAKCGHLSFDDLIIFLKQTCISENLFIAMLEWWPSYCLVYPLYAEKTRDLFNVTRFQLSCETKAEFETEVSVMSASSFRFYRNGILRDAPVPVSASTIPQTIQKALNTTTLFSRPYHQMLLPLPFLVWSEQICQHICMTGQLSQHDELRVEVLSLFSKERKRLGGAELSEFDQWIANHVRDLPCIPCQAFTNGKIDNVPLGTDLARNVYMPDADLSMFQDFGTFKRVPFSVFEAGVSKDLLFHIGVRGSVSVDLLLQFLHNMNWYENPQPVINYFRKTNLTDEDMQTLRTRKFLPGTSDQTALYSPCELYLPIKGLANFRNLNILKWPGYLDEDSEDGKFMQILGCLVSPPLEVLLSYVSSSLTDRKEIVACLSFIAESLKRRHDLTLPIKEDQLLNVKFLPTVRSNLVQDEIDIEEMHSPLACYWEEGIRVLGFPILDPRIGASDRKLFAECFGCKDRPSTDALLSRFQSIVQECRSALEGQPTKEIQNAVVPFFKKMCEALHPVCNKLTTQQLNGLSSTALIPCLVNDRIEWFHLNEVCFDDLGADEICRLLFHTVERDVFLAAIGVARMPSSQNLLDVVCKSPETILRKVGEDVYTQIVHRLAASSSQLYIGKEALRCKFLPAFRSVANYPSSSFSSIESRKRPFNEGIFGSSNSNVREDGNNEVEFSLASGSEIYVMDDAMLADTFNVLRAPPELYLTPFYKRLGARNISDSVRREVETNGRKLTDTAETRRLKARLSERRPFLVSPMGVSQHRLQIGDMWVVANESLAVRETQEITEVLSLGSEKQRRNLSCYVKRDGRGHLRRCLYITRGFTWFDVGSAIGKVLLREFTISDAFYFASILESPLTELKSRGFPVDILMSVRSSKRFKTDPSAEFQESGTNNTGNGEHVGGRPDIRGLEDIAALFSTGKEQLTRGLGHCSVAGIGGLLPGKDGRLRSGAGNDDQGTNEGFDCETFQAPPLHIVRSEGSTVARMAGKASMLVFSREGQISSEKFVTEKWESVVKFADALTELAYVAGISVRSMAVYHDWSRTIAFNSRGGIYCNFAHYAALHDGGLSASWSSEVTSSAVSCLSFWLVVLCHELAHNSVSGHGRLHGSMTESYVQQFMPKLYADLPRILHRLSGSHPASGIAFGNF